MTGIYRIAELNIGISSLHGEVHRLCEEYRIAGGMAAEPATGTESGAVSATGETDRGSGVVVDYSIETSQSDIDFERAKSIREAEAEGIPVRQYPDGYLETLAVYRKIAERMPDYDTMLFHGSCVAVDGAGYLFTAKSGTGKSTHTRLWRQLLGDCAVMINDDKPLIRVTGDGEAIIYGTPWNGKHRLSTNTAVPLKAICILERAEKNAIRPITVGEAYPMLLQQTYRPLDAAALGKTLPLIDRLAASVSLWRMGCNMDLEAAKVAYESMRG